MIRIEHDSFMHRTVIDTENPITFQEQSQCFNCNGWINDEDVVWGDVIEDNEHAGIQVPWCVRCSRSEYPQLSLENY